jgi:glycosyltransferase involved in cell wall biosynthesis
VIGWLRARLRGRRGGGASDASAVLHTAYGPAAEPPGAGPSPRPAARRGAAGSGTAVVAACYDFPIYSHAFVYQEMLGLVDMGLDVRLLCWRRADPSYLHAAFHRLRDGVVVLESSWTRHRDDYRYFQRRFPERVTAVMGRLSTSLGQPVHRLESDYEVLMAFTFARAVEEAGADYLHTYFFYEETFFALVASHLLDVPRGVSCYADHVLADSRFKDFALHFERLDVAVATSRRVAGELRALAGEAYAHTILVKPNGVDGSRFRPPPEPRRQPAEPLELISVSRIEPKKGLLHLCDVARTLRDAGRRARFHVVGAPDSAVPGALEYARAFEQRRRALGVEDAFVLHGFLPQERVVPLLARADVFVAPYVELANGDKDGIPTSLLEAMAAGLPAICSDAGSILEAVDDGVEALVAPGADPDRMAAHALRLLDEPGLARRLGEGARARFLREFDVRVTEPVLHARIARILERRARPTGARRVAEAPPGTLAERGS